MQLNVWLSKELLQGRAGYKHLQQKSIAWASIYKLQLLLDTVCHQVNTGAQMKQLLASIKIGTVHCSFKPSGGPQLMHSYLQNRVEEASVAKIGETHHSRVGD